MHANSVLCSRELGTRAGKSKNGCLKWPQRSNQMQMDSDMPTHSDLMTGNAGSAQATLIVVREKTRVVR